LPSQASRVLAQIEQGNLVVQTPQVTRKIELLERAVDRLTGGLIFAALLFSGVLSSNAGKMVYANGFFIAAFIALLWVIFSGRGRDSKR